MKKKRKINGFTLVELLAVIAILAIIGTISVNIYLKTIANSKEHSTNLALSNIKKAAELYTKDKSDEIEWVNQHNNFTYAGRYSCITISELINAGYFNKDFFKKDIYQDAKINNNTFVEISQNSNYTDTDVNIYEEANSKLQCEVSTANTNLKNLKINNVNNYQNRITFDIEPAGNYTISYQIDNETKTEECNQNSCTLTNLSTNKYYFIRICNANICEDITLGTTS